MTADYTQKPYQLEYAEIGMFLNGIVFNGKRVDSGSYMKAYTHIHTILTSASLASERHLIPLCECVQTWVRQYAAHSVASDMMTLKSSRSIPYDEFTRFMINLFSYLDKHYLIRGVGLCPLPEMCAKERQRAITDIRGAVTATVWCTKKCKVNVPEEVWNIILSFMTMTRFVVEPA